MIYIAKNREVGEKCSAEKLQLLPSNINVTAEALNFFI